jgi:DeoR/GlpR family transcriptional regulator of sugar metabolism
MDSSPISSSDKFLSVEDSAFRIFACGLRTISRDLQALAEQGIVLPLHSQLISFY